MLAVLAMAVLVVIVVVTGVASVPGVACKVTMASSDVSSRASVLHMQGHVPVELNFADVQKKGCRHAANTWCEHTDVHWDAGCGNSKGAPGTCWVAKPEPHVAPGIMTR
jgi:hypothetical protein